jgi:hypothetical protein
MTTIKNIGNGWYNFESIPQGYIKVCNLNCGSEKAAIKFARKLLQDKTAEVRVVEA